MGRRGTLVFAAAMVIAAIGATPLILADQQSHQTVPGPDEPREVLVASELIPAGMTANQALNDNLIETLELPERGGR